MCSAQAAAAAACCFAPAFIVDDDTLLLVPQHRHAVLACRFTRSGAWRRWWHWRRNSRSVARIQNTRCAPVEPPERSYSSRTVRAPFTVSGTHPSQLNEPKPVRHQVRQQEVDLLPSCSVMHHCYRHCDVSVRARQIIKGAEISGATPCVDGSLTHQPCRRHAGCRLAAVHACGLTSNQAGRRQQHTGSCVHACEPGR